MSQVSTTELLNSLELVRRNPSAIQRLAVKTVEAVMDGSLNLVDPTSPFVLLMETGACLTATAINHNTALNRKQYPKLAQDMKDIYLHMSDKEYAGRFSTPSRTTVMFVFSKDELYQRAVQTDVTAIRKLTIPRHTSVTVAGYKFTMQYPIDIKIMGHGGLQITYDSSSISPLQTLSSNLLEWRIVKINSVEYLVIDVPLNQFAIETHYGSLNSVMAYSETFDFEDMFYYARIYNVNDDGTFTEIKTTHSDQVYDPTVATAVLTVLESQLKVEIPQIYFTNGLLTNQVRIDIYTTSGNVELSLTDYPASAFSAEWVDLDDVPGSKYWAPLKVFSTMWIAADATVTGGAGEMSIDTLRGRTIDNANGEIDIPITPVQVASKFTKLNYDVVLSKDTITERTYLATRALPTPSDGSVATGIGACINTVETSFSKLKTLSTTKDNGERITILPSTLYQNISGVTTIVDSTTTTSLKALELEAKVAAVNNANYLFTPFHYVLDSTSDEFDCRAYYLDAPKITGKEFIGDNATISFAVSTDSYRVDKTDTGYRITVKVVSDATYKAFDDDQLFVQASFTPVGEIETAQILGTLIGTSGDERVWQFDFNTNWDLDANDSLLLTNVTMFEDDINRKTPMALDINVDLIYGITGYTQTGLKVSELDGMLAGYLVPSDSLAIVKERLKFDFGSPLKHLWTNSRSLASSIEYRKYTQDVYWTYPDDVWEVDSTGTIKLHLDGDGKSVGTLLHRAGDQILTNGQPTIRFHAGETMYVDGAPIPINVRGMARQIDLLLLDGLYYFATSESSVDYRSSIPLTIVDWVETDIAKIKKVLLENTEIYFQPRRTIGDIDVVIGEGVETNIESTQSFTIDFYMSAAGYGNSDLRTQVSNTALSCIASGLDKSTVAMDEIVSDIRSKLGGDVIAFKISGLGGEKALTAITLTDNTGRCTIGKKLIVEADNTLSVKDDVTIDFIKHTA